MAPICIDGQTRRDCGSHSQLVSELVFDADRVQFTGKNSALPLNYFTRIAQNKVDSVKAAITPKIDEIKQHYDGEEAHNKIMAAYKEIGVHRFTHSSQCSSR